MHLFMLFSSPHPSSIMSTTAVSTSSFVVHSTAKGRGNMDNTSGSIWTLGTPNRQATCGVMRRSVGVMR